MLKKINNIIVNRLHRISWRHLLPAILLASSIGYGIFGLEYSKHAASLGARSETKQLLDEQAKNNPTFADELARLRTEYGDVAVATKLAFDARMASEKINLPPLAVQLRRNEPLHEAVLIDLVQRTGMTPDDPALDPFLTSYDTAIRLMPDPAQRNEVLSSLRDASRSHEDWSYISRGYDALLVWRATRNDPSLWQLYKQEYNWLADVMMERIALEIATSTEENINGEIFQQDRIHRLLEVAAHHGDVLKRINAQSPEHAAFAYHVVERYGDVLAISTDRYGLPLLEVLEVIYANPETLDNYMTTHGQAREPAELQAAFLSEIYKQQPNVWRYARTTPLALQLFLDARLQADAILARFGNNPGFLLQFYDAYGSEKEVGKNQLFLGAAAALAQYEDVAALLLFDYRDSAAFRAALVNPDIGTRIIPFAARYPDEIVAANEDPGYVNKYFDENGRLKDADRWWESVPGGSILKIASNLKHGYPCDWDEMGWAVYDAADVGLMLFTAGASKAITSAAKIAVRGGARTAEIAAIGTRRTAESIGSMSKRLMAKLNKTSNVSITREVAPTSVSNLSTAAKRFSENGNDFARHLGAVGSPQDLKKWKRIGYALAVTKMSVRSELLSKAPEQITETIVQSSTEAVSIPGRILASAFKE